MQSTYSESSALKKGELYPQHKHLKANDDPLSTAHRESVMFSRICVCNARLVQIAWRPRALSYCVPGKATAASCGASVQPAHGNQQAAAAHIVCI